MSDLTPPIPEVTVPIGEGCFDLTTGLPYEPAAAGAVTVQPQAPAQPTIEAGA